MEEYWNTSITKIEPNNLIVRGFSLADLVGRISFTDMIFLIIKGKLPSPQESRVMDAILVSSIDHGATPPSTTAARTVASTGATINAALAAGILAINRHHGGAIENCMLILKAAVDTKEKDGKNTDDVATDLVKLYRAQKKRLAGFGHRLHTNDPRTARLFAIAGDAGLSGKYVEMALSIQRAISKETGRELPINVDGAIAALLCELEFPHLLANAVFMIARLPGLTAHIYEEMSEQRPMRWINPQKHKYVGPEDKQL